MSPGPAGQGRHGTGHVGHRVVTSATAQDAAGADNFNLNAGDVSEDNFVGDVLIIKASKNNMRMI